MNPPDTLLDAQATALLRRLAREQEMRTRRLHEEADAQSLDIIRRTRSEARARVHQAILDTRRDAEQAIARRRAALDTRARRARQSMLRDLLDEAWRQMPSALEARWQDAKARAAWCEAACAQALERLLEPQRLVLQLDRRWAGELAPVAKALLQGAAPVELEVDAVEGFGAGLRLRSGNACVDATVAGLLASRERVAAELLAELERRLSAARPMEAIA